MIVLTSLHLILSLIFILFQVTCAQIEITVSAPVNPVEHGGILSIHCQVWHLNTDDYEVTILHALKNQRTEKLSVDEGVLQGVDDRVFLAVRQLIDGSTVYFLSITDASREDEGEYFCKVLTKSGTIGEVAAQSVELGVMYFPDESEPLCAPSTVSQTYKEGSSLVFNCSSEIANPPVSIQWSSTTRSKPLTTREYTDHGRVYSVLTLNVLKNDQGAVFLCKMTSTAFPGELQTCHVGPLTVIPNEKNRGTLTEDRVSNNQLTTLSLDTEKHPSNSETRPFNPTDCKDVCPVKSRVLYWMIATIIAGALSLIFFIFAIVLLIKYIRVPTAHRAHYVTARQNTEDLYSELECRRIGELGKVYMALEKPAKPNETESTPKYGIHYHEMPNAAKVSSSTD